MKVFRSGGRWMLELGKITVADKHLVVLPFLYLTMIKYRLDDWRTKPHD